MNRTVCGMLLACLLAIGCGGEGPQDALTSDQQQLAGIFNNNLVYETLDQVSGNGYQTVVTINDPYTGQPSHWGSYVHFNLNHVGESPRLGQAAWQECANVQMNVFSLHTNTFYPVTAGPESTCNSSSVDKWYSLYWSTTVYPGQTADASVIAWFTFDGEGNSWNFVCTTPWLPINQVVKSFSSCAVYERGTNGVTSTGSATLSRP